MNLKSIIAVGGSIEGDNWLRIDGISNKMYNKLKKESDNVLGNGNIAYPESFALKLVEPIKLHINGILYTFHSLMNFNYPHYNLEDYDLRVNFHGSDNAIKLKSSNLRITKNKNNKKDGINMFNNTMNDNLEFDKVDGLIGISVLDGKIAYNLNGKWVSLGLDNSLVDVTGFTKELDVDSMILPMAVSQIQKGDLIIIEGQPVIVIGVQGNEIKTTNGDGEIKSVVPTINQLYGGAIVKKVFNPLINGMGGNALMNGQMNPMMLMMLMDGDGNNNDMMSTMMMMSMFQQQNNGNNMMGMMNQQPMNNMNMNMNMQQQPMTANPNYNMNQPQPQPNVNFAEQQVQGWSQPINQEQQPMNNMNMQQTPQQVNESVNQNNNQ